MSRILFPQVVFIIFMCVCYVFLKCRADKNNNTKKFANTCAILLIIYISAMVYLVAGDRQGAVECGLELTPFESYKLVLTKYNSVDILVQIYQNILLFIPLGILLPETLFLRGKKFTSPLVVLLGSFVSFVIELAQFTYSIGYSEADDIINNTLGCAIGCGVFFFADKVSVDSDGIRLKRGWLYGLLPAVVVVGIMAGIVMYREAILFHL